MSDATQLTAAARAAFERGELTISEAHYREAIARFGAHSDWLANLGMVQLRLGRAEDAAQTLTQASTALPEHPAVVLALGIAQLHAGQASAATETLDRAVTLGRDNPEAHNALGLARAALGDIDRAGEAFASALALAPRFTAALNNWCEALSNAGNLPEAVAVASRAAREQPDDASAWFKLGELRMRAGELLAAREALARSATLHPGYSPTHQNLGLIEQWSGRLQDAQAQFRAALSCDPTNADARFGLATTLLKLRQSEEGWALYAVGRAGASDVRSRSPRVPAWDGGVLPRGALLVNADQGLGDVMQFARFLSATRVRVPRLLVYTDAYRATLRPLLESLAAVDAVVDRASGAQELAARCKMSALPHLLRLGSAAFDPTAPYLAPPTAAARRWGERLARLPAPKVGLCWGGNPRPDFVDANRIDARRSMTLERLAGLGRIPGITFVSLQKGAAAATRSRDMPLIDWTDDLYDYGETAGLIAQLDLVVSVDTSIVHCAGAIGTPVWMLDRFDNCWRWGTDPANPGWYRALRVLRQRSFGDWASVIEELRASLSAWRRDYRRA